MELGFWEVVGWLHLYLWGFCVYCILAICIRECLSRAFSVGELVRLETTIKQRKLLENSCVTKKCVKNYACLVNEKEGEGV